MAAMATAALVRGADAKSRAPLRARGPAAFAVAFAATGGGTTATADLASGAGPATAASAVFAAARSMVRAAAFAGTEGGRIAASASKAST